MPLPPGRAAAAAAAGPVSGASDARGWGRSGLRGGGDAGPGDSGAPRGEEATSALPRRLLHCLPFPGGMSRDAFIAQKDRLAADAASSCTWWDDASVDLPVSEADRTAALEEGDPLAELARSPASPAGVLLAPTGSTLLAAVRAGGGGGKGCLPPSFITCPFLPPIRLAVCLPIPSTPLPQCRMELRPEHPPGVPNAPSVSLLADVALPGRALLPVQHLLFVPS